ncbi:MAG TPA: hypothetical protein VHB74_00790 [Devosia sp.]|nr:hypothetical protein [Devosia sp.]
MARSPSRMPVTRLAGLPRRALWGIAMGLLAAIGGLAVLALLHQDAAVSIPQNQRDMATYTLIVEAMHRGQGYYDAVAAALRQNHYGMQSVFNWRTPLLLTGAASFPSLIWPQMLQGIAALVALLLAARLALRELGGIAAALVFVLGLGSLAMVAVPGSVLMAEVPAGVLILLSASAYGLGWRRVGFIAAVLALFIRELAGPYVLVCAVLAWREGRWREVTGWMAAGLAYAGYFLWHMHMVALHVAPGDPADMSGWLQWGGAGFVLQTAQFDGVFAVAPLRVTALILPAAWLGLLAWPGAAGERIGLTVSLYLALFAVAGKPFNTYWGALYTPLLVFGLAWFPFAVADLWRGVAAPPSAERRSEA